MTGFAYAQAAQDTFGMLNSLLIPTMLIIGIMYFLMIRPQQKRLKEHQAMVAGVRRGDTIVTSGGIIGKVAKVGRGRARRQGQSQGQGQGKRRGRVGMSPATTNRINR